MTTLRQILKPKVLMPHLVRALALLPADSSLAVWSREGIIARVGGLSDSITPATEGVASYPIYLECREVGRLLVKTSDADFNVDPVVAFLGEAIQGLAEAIQTRQAVSTEALESYREIAVMQRAVQNFNQTLRPEIVAKVLLQEIAGRAPKMDFGAVYRRNHNNASYGRLNALGDFADDMFDHLEAGDFIRLLEAAPGILNDIANHTRWPLRHSGVGALLLLPLYSNDENLGTLVLGSSLSEAFAASDLKRAETLASVAATAIRNAQLFAAQKTMFHSFVDVMSSAIDAASPFTAGHCQRVPGIVRLIAKAVDEDRDGPFAGFTFSDDGWDELNLAASLHDCGKVNTPSWLIDKSTKLEAVMDRIELVQLRFELLKHHLLASYFKKASEGALSVSDRQGLDAELQALDQDSAFLRNCNLGKEFMSDDVVRRIETIAARQWTDAFGQMRCLIEETEREGLLIKRGTLTDKERSVIEDHARHTIRMLSKIPFPNELKDVVRHAGGHHERMDGKGYPLGLKDDKLSIQARIIALADVFEALTAPDRPYRSPLKLSKALDILADMSRSGHIDPDLFHLFVSRGIYKEYAKNGLMAEQSDEVDESRYLIAASL
ncbi:MAG: HD domain-containing protein [Rhodospirillales bacterium]|nr:MAG: HD domain-containing protein [Rhodospirillales bacterium]